MDREKLRLFPKAELHCHLDGSLSKGFISRELGRDVELSELQATYDCQSLKEYLEKFDLPIACMQTAEGIRGAGYDFIRTVADENVNYVEVRFAPNCSAHDDFRVQDVIESLLSGLEKGRKEFGTEYNVIVCAMRHHSDEENIKMIKAAREFLGRGVCCADLAGDEAAFPMSKYLDLFREIRALGMPYVIHAGECGSVQNIRDAVECGAKRIGHGIAMRGCPDVQKLVKDRGAGIEMCPISNLQTKAVPGPEVYPMREFLDQGLLVTVNTDNRTVSGTSLTKELEFIQENYRISDDEIVRMMRNAVEVSYADDTVKDRLLRMMKG